MKKRIKKLREQTLNAIPKITPERAILITEFYKSDIAQRISIPVKRAMALKYILENKKLCINEGELIVGERGPEPKAVPTYPEIIVHGIEDLEILNSREKVSYKVDEKTKEIYRDKIIPFWKGKSIRDKIFENLSQQWKDAFESGVFTEFMEQRSPGHTVLDDKIYKEGLKDFIKRIDIRINSLDYLNDFEAINKKEELKAMKIAANALINFSKRYSKELKKLAKKEEKEVRKQELLEMSRICNKVVENKPDTFWEALQYYWFVHIGVITELNPWDSFNPGRLDQHLYPFYKKGIEEGTLTRERAKELLESFWIKFNNQPAPPKVGVTAEESSTYTDFALINIGGVKPDGSDATNELSYLILDVIEEMRILQPSSMVQISKKNPDRLLKRAIKIIKTGFGQPSIFNTDAIVQEHIRQGKELLDARQGGASGCVEAGVFGKEAYILTGYFNIPKVLEITLNNGFDSVRKKKIGLNIANPENLTSFDSFYNAFEKQLSYFLDLKIKGNNIIEKIYSNELPAPFLSLFIDDCIDKGMDYHSGGARYNNSYIQGVGLGTITDSFASIKYNVYDNKFLTMKELLKALKNDFKENEIIRQRLINKTPKFGNDDDYADEIMRKVFDSYFKSIDGRPNTKGGHYRVNLLPTTVHIYFGRVTGAMPDGRKAHEPLSEGVSPVQGADRKGPSAVIKSLGKLDHLRTGGTLLNQKFTPQLLSDEAGENKLLNLIRTYFRYDGHHIQFNVITAETLKKAQEEPEKYRDLIVRVAGYSDYFIDLNKDLQDEIIRRTEHESF
jgi:formate C-acetyltransferase